jgi:pantoate--beta-alanine ligase
MRSTSVLSLQILRTVSGVRAARNLLCMQKKSVGFVPTMGALHNGHMKLMQRAKSENEVVVTSIFVNPTQFSEGEDLDKYPRPLEKDIRMLESAGIDILFLPDQETMYPTSPLCHVEPAAFNSIAEGNARPDFFRGVATICCKLFNIVQPTSTYFGQKDISQSILIRRMTEDLNIPVRICICETTREFDGLAMSSRNAYLSVEERQKATILFTALDRGRKHCLELSTSSRNGAKR